jgi:adenylosuccinate synthase
MKADVLSGLGTLKVGTGYKTAKGVITDFPADMRLLAECKPIFEELTPWEDPGTEGWDAVATKGWDAMPKALKDYIAFIERKTGVPVGTVSFGPKRHQTVRKDI